MNLLMIPRMALKALAQNKLRTGLTMLGIIIGVGAVICVVAIGEGASASVERAITNIGANMIWVEAGGVNRQGVRTGAFGTKTLTLGDYESIKEHIHLVTNVTPQADTRGQVVYGNQNWGTSVRGVGPEYIAMKGWNVVRGGMYTDVDVERVNNVCVLGQTIVDEFFGSLDPIVETIRVKDGAEVLLLNSREPCAMRSTLKSAPSVRDTESFMRYVISNLGIMLSMFPVDGSRLARIAHTATPVGARMCAPEQSRLSLAVPHRGKEKSGIRTYEARRLWPWR